VLLPCHGSSEAGPAATDVARELGERGLAEVVEDIEQVVAAARGGREVLALDGCAAGCQARLLDAHGVRALRALNLAEPGSEVAAASSVAELEAAAVPFRRTRRPQPAPSGPSEQRSHGLDEYLLAVDALTAPVVECGTVVDAPTVAAHVARLLRVSRPTAGEMVGRLEHQGLVRRGAHKDLLLTAEGRARADRLLRSQRILECFVVDTLGYSLAECHEQARRLAGGFGNEPLERIWAALGRPDHCPHGRPIDAAAERRSARGLLALSAVPDGAAVTVDRLEEGSRERLDVLADAAVRPGTLLSEVTHNAAAGVVTFVAAGERRTISSMLAAGVLVSSEGRQSRAR
jgi:DtxR family Mn-dependent transcriptional regulator